MISILLYLGLIACLIVLCFSQIDTYHAKQLQNNDTAVRHRNLAVMCGILCIILSVAFLTNMDEFFNMNHLNKRPMKEKSMQSPLHESALGQFKHTVPLSQGLIFKPIKS
jgi:hypothetical protein